MKIICKNSNFVESSLNRVAINKGEAITLQVKLRNGHGELINLLNSSVVISIINSIKNSFEKPTELIDEYTIQFTIDFNDITGEEDSNIRFNVTYSDGKKERFPSEDAQNIIISSVLESNSDIVGYVTFEKVKKTCEKYSHMNLNASNIPFNDSDEILSKIGDLKKLGITPRSLTDTIMERGLNPKDFGAVGDGKSHPLSEIYLTLASAQEKYPHATDLSDEIDWCAIQGLVNFCVNTIKQSGEFQNPCVLEFPSGIYVTNKTINSKPYIKFVAKGFVVIRLNNAGTALKISCDSNEPNFYKEMWSIGSLITAATGGAFILQCSKNKVANSVGLDIGNSASNEKDFARFNISHLGIIGFDVGLQIRNINTYLGVFNSLHLEGNRVNIKTLNVKGNAINAGENMRFNNSIIAGAVIGLKNESDVLDFVFSNCSFDFLDNVLELNKGYSTIRFNHCYFEEISYSLINSLATPISIQGRGNVVTFINCEMYSPRRQYIKGKHLTVMVDGFVLRYTRTDILPNALCFFEKEDTNKYKTKHFLFTRDYAQCTAENLNLNRYGDFETANLGESLLNNTLNSYRKVSSFNVKVAEISGEVSYSGGQSLKIVGTQGCYLAFELANKIKAMAFEEIVVGFRFALNITNALNLAVRVDAYDNNEVLIKSSDSYVPSVSGTNILEWSFTPYIKNFVLPAGTQSYNINIIVSNFNGTVYLDDIIINKI